MKFLTTTFLLSALSLGVMAESPVTEEVTLNPSSIHKNFNAKKEKILNRINKRLNHVQKRKTCMGQATSLGEMQACRIEKNKNKPFKLKKGMTFQEKQKQKLDKMSRRISILQNKKNCVSKATTMKEIKSCKKSTLTPMIRPIQEPILR